MIGSTIDWLLVRAAGLALPRDEREWILGDLETHDRTCRRLATVTGARLLAVDFRRAPEYPWPAAVVDAEAAVEWASAELDAPAPVVAGDSSGGHIALLLALRLRDRARPCGGLAARVSEH